MPPATRRILQSLKQKIMFKDISFGSIVNVFLGVGAAFAAMAVVHYLWSSMSPSTTTTKTTTTAAS